MKDTGPLPGTHDEDVVWYSRSVCFLGSCLDMTGKKTTRRPKKKTIMCGDWRGPPPEKRKQKERPPRQQTGPSVSRRIPLSTGVPADSADPTALLGVRWQPKECRQRNAKPHPQRTIHSPLASDGSPVDHHGSCDSLWRPMAAQRVRMWQRRSAATAPVAKKKKKNNRTRPSCLSHSLTLTLVLSHAPKEKEKKEKNKKTALTSDKAICVTHDHTLY
jgi:hypothetical protein